MSLDPTLTLLYDFERQKSLDPMFGLGPPLDIVRSGYASYWDANGVLRYATSNEARFSHEPVTGSSLGLLVEDTRTNICLQSENFSASHVLGTAFINQDVMIAPDGRVTADRLIDTGAGGTAADVSTRTIGETVTSGDNTYSCFVKSDGLDWIDMRTFGFDAGGNGETYFDIANGEIGTESGNHTARIKDVGDGWYRCSVSFNTITDLAGFCYIYVASANAIRTVSLDGTSSVFLWGQQCESGDFATSYIRTVGSSVTRNIDEVFKDDVSWYNASVGTMYCEYDLIGAPTSLSIPFDISDGTLANRITFYNTSARLARFFVADTSVAQADMSTTVTPALNEFVKEVGSWSASDFSAYANGSAATPDSSGTIPSGISEFNIGKNGAGTQIHNGHIKQVRYYNERKPDQFNSDLSNGLVGYGFPDPFTTGEQPSIDESLIDSASHVSGIMSGM